MTHQIIGLREFVDSKTGELKKFDTFYDRNWHADDLKDLFKNPQSYVGKIPSEERYNLYFTVAHSVGKREFRSQKYIPFDIDGIDVTRAKETVEVGIRALGCDPKSTLSLFSGHGVQFHIELEQAFEDPDLFEKQRIYYQACCQRITRALEAAGLPGKGDPTMWSLARIMRMPNTLNVKPNKPNRMSEVINAESKPITFDLHEASGLPKVQAEDQIIKYPEPDTATVLKECLNLQAMLREPSKVSESLWYACASVIGNLGGNPAEGRRLWHEYSSKDPRYSASEADRKLTQALSSSGPRTCANFATLDGNKCSECPHFKKLKSPIVLQGPDYIRTRETGFYSISVDKETGAVSKKPNYDDLRKFFEEEHFYVVNSESGGIFTFNESHYEHFPELMVKGFAQEHFEQCDNRKALEFAALVKRTNLKLPTWFADSTEYKMNLQNGVLDVRTGKFEKGNNQELGFMFTLDFDYDPHAKAPIFEKFLDDITCGDAELRRLLLEFGGYALSNDEYWEHKALLLVGDGSNGKNTFIQVLKDLAGDGYAAISMKNLNNEQHLARLEGKLFNFSEEASALAFKDTDAFKTICSGGEINVKTVYEKPYDIVNRAKIIIACNDIPESKDGSFGFFRRFAVAPFNATFTESNRDVNISKKLKAERAGILNMLLDAYKEMKDRGYLSTSKLGQAKLKQYKVENDPILQWLDTITIKEKTSESGTTNESLYTNYAQFCETDKVKPKSRVSFFMRISKLIPEAEERKEVEWDGKAMRKWKGVYLSDEAF